MLKVSLPRFQAIVGLTAGLFSIAGAVFSLPQFLKPASVTGELVAIVEDSKSQKAISNATIEILTPQNALVTTLTTNTFGRARQALPEGPYRLRVSHPRFSAEVRQIHVLPGQTAEVRVRLHAGSSSPLRQAQRAVSHGVRTLREFLRL